MSKKEEMGNSCVGGNGFAPHVGGDPAASARILVGYLQAFGASHGAMPECKKCPKPTSKRHTDLKSYVSEAKFVKESDFDVKSRLAPPKSTEIDEKHDSDTENFSNFNFAKAGAPPVPSRTAVRPGPSLGKIKI